MNRDFIAIRQMEGELKLSHKKSGYGLTVTSKEFIIQKPHTNYYLSLQDIWSIMPVDPYGLKPVKFVPDWSEASELVSVLPGTRHYKIKVGQAVLHNRSGLRQLQACDFILPISNEMLLAMTAYAGLSSPLEGNPLTGGTGE